MSPELVVSTYLYNDLFSTDVSKIKKIVTLLNQAMKVRDGLIEKQVQSIYSWREIFMRITT